MSSYVEYDIEIYMMVAGHLMECKLTPLNVSANG